MSGWSKRRKQPPTTTQLKSTIRVATTILNRISCPVTAGVPTRMTEEAFRRRCALHMAEDGGYCAMICEGEILPHGLEFIEIATLQKEVENMAIKEQGKCELCSVIKNIGNIRDKKLCSVCEHLWRTALNNPQLLVRVLREAQGQDWVDKNVTTVDAAQAEPVLADLDRVQQELAASRETFRTLHAEIAAELGCDPATDFNIATEFSILKQENERLREELNHAATESEATRYSVEIGSITTRDSGILDLALDVLDGKITGIDADRLRALR